MYSGKSIESMGSSESTSRYVLQTTEGTGLVPGGVIATRPLIGETLGNADPDGLGFPADRPQAEATRAHTAATVMTIHRVRLWYICVP